MTESTHRIAVVAAVVRRGMRYLVCRRPMQKRHGGLWEFPGGKVMEGETRLAAVRRELDEELGIETTGIGHLLYSAADAGSPFLIEFVEAFATGDPVLHEHTELGWFAAAELLELSLAPADARFAEMLASGTITVRD
ncbi:MAG: NUDIX domain-containing protein [Gemmatimonadota bacterium]